LEIYKFLIMFISIVYYLLNYPLKQNPHRTTKPATPAAKPKPPIHTPVGAAPALLLLVLELPLPAVALPPLVTLVFVVPEPALVLPLTVLATFVAAVALPVI
jgi:hypothetical protein